MRADVIDLYHGDIVTNFGRVAQGGTKGIIHKATQGLGVTDIAYAERRKMATDSGLLWGAYHFNTGDTIGAQVQHFLDAAQPDANTAMFLDFEDNRVSQMSFSQCMDFMRQLDAALGRKCGIYSGNRIKALIVGTSDDNRAFFASHKLWGCEYGPTWRNFDANARKLPWPQPWLWQFTGDGIGPQPHSIPGIQTQGIDINQYNGDPEMLHEDWT